MGFNISLMIILILIVGSKMKKGVMTFIPEKECPIEYKARALVETFQTSDIAYVGQVVVEKDERFGLFPIHADVFEVETTDEKKRVVVYNDFTYCTTRTVTKKYIERQSKQMSA